MPWIRIDDHFDEHPKLAAVGPIGWGIWLAGLAYCNRNLTDGFIPRAIAMSLGGDWQVEAPLRPDERTILWSIDRSTGRGGLAHGSENMDTAWVIGILLDHGLWLEAPGGYQVHDYDQYQLTKAQILEIRAAKQAAGRAGGQASAQARAAPSAQAESKPKPKPNTQEPKPTPSAAHAHANGEVSAALFYYDLTKVEPTNRAQQWVNELEVEFGTVKVKDAMTVAWGKEKKINTFLGRVKAILVDRGAIVVTGTPSQYDQFEPKETSR